ISFINQMTGRDFTSFFKQYLFYPHPPALEYKTKQKGKNAQISYRWRTDVSSFQMPVEITSSYSYSFGKQIKTFTRLDATNDWQTVTLPNFDAKDFDVNSEKFYVKKQEVK